MPKSKLYGSNHDFFIVRMHTECGYGLKLFLVVDQRVNICRIADSGYLNVSVKLTENSIFIGGNMYLFRSETCDKYAVFIAIVDYRQHHSLCLLCRTNPTPYVASILETRNPRYFSAWHRGWIGVVNPAGERQASVQPVIGSDGCGPPQRMSGGTRPQGDVNHPRRLTSQVSG